MHLKAKSARQLASLSALGAGIVIAAGKAKADIIVSGPLTDYAGFTAESKYDTWSTDNIKFFDNGKSVGYGLPQGVGIGFSTHRGSYSASVATIGNRTRRVLFSNRDVYFVMKSGHLDLFNAGQTIFDRFLTATSPYGLSAKVGSVAGVRFYNPPAYCLSFIHHCTGQANQTIFGNDAASNKYALFYFPTFTQEGDVTIDSVDYGWLELSVHVGVHPVTLPYLTIEGIAYDTTGATIPAGKLPPPVPEPSTFVSTALGALAMGAIGLRAWRKRKA